MKEPCIHSQYKISIHASRSKLVDRVDRCNRSKDIYQRQSLDSSSFLILSRTSRRPPFSRRTLLGDLVTSSTALSSFPRIRPGLGGAFRGLAESSTAAAVEGAGISSHSALAISSLRRKNGQSDASKSRDSRASADEIGTGEDFNTAAATSSTGKARRLRVLGRADVEPEGFENNIQTLSATPLKRPSKHRRRISSWLSFINCSLVIPAVLPLGVPLVGVAGVMDR